MSETLLGPALPGASPLSLGASHVRVGTTSWADRSLVRDGGFYPRKTMTARARLTYYCERFPLAEIATTFRFPPTPDLCAQWVERTPEGFVFDLRAWSLLVGSPTLPDSLWPDLQGAVSPMARDRRRLYPAHLSPDALEECWARFAHALGPLRDAGRLGVVTLAYPAWFSPRAEAWDELSRLTRRLPGCRLAVELRHPRWLEGSACEETLEWLEARGLGFVCVDGPPGTAPPIEADDVGGGPVVAATSDVAVVRFRGRRAVEGESWSWPYRYDEGELAGWVPAVNDLASSAPDVHLILDNCWRSDAVDNASTLMRLLST